MSKKILFISICFITIFSIIFFSKPILAANNNVSANNAVNSDAKCENHKGAKKDKLKAALKNLLDNKKISQTDYDKSISLIDQNNGKLKGINFPDSVKSALKANKRAKLEKKLNEAVKNGKITQDEANQKLKNFDEGKWKK